MKMLICAVCILALASISCIAADSKCKMLSNDDQRHGVYSCVQATLDDIKDIPDEAKWIRFTVSNLSQLPEKTFARFALRGLSFYNCEIGHINANAFDGLDKLQRLTFYGSNIPVLKASWFKGLSSLTHLFLDRNDIVYIEPNVFSLIPNLEQLNIEDNNLNCLARQALAPLRKLRHARIGQNPWLCSCGTELVRWMKHRKIDYGLRNTMIERSECTMEHIKQYRDFNAPPYNTVRNFSVSESGYIRMSPARDVLCFGNNISVLLQIPDNVRSIKFVNSEISKIPRFAFLRFGNSLTSLYFRNCNIREIDPRAFSGLPKLEKLFMFDNSFSTVRSEWFRDLHSLENLALDKNEIDYIEPSVFLLLGKLKHWSLGNNRMQCISTNEFDSLKNLKKVVLAHNPWNCSCQASFRKWLHEKRVSYVISRGQCIDGRIQESEDLFEQSFERRKTKINSQSTELSYSEMTPGHRNQTGTELYDEFSIEEPTSEGRDTKITDEEVDHNRNIEIANNEYYRLLTKNQKQYHARMTGLNTRKYTDFKRENNFYFPAEDIESHSNDHDLEQVSWEKLFENWSFEFPSSGSYVSVDGTIWDVLSISTDATAIRFENSVIPKILNGVFSPFVSTLRRLEFLNCMVQDIEPQAFNGLVNLEELVLSNNQIQVVKSAWFEGIPNLRRLSLTRNSITRIDNGVFQLLTNLEQLEISSNKLNCFEIDELYFLANLNTMDIGNNPWSCFCQRKLNEWLDVHKDFTKDIFDEMVDWDCSMEYPDFRFTNEQETNSIDNEKPDTEKEIEEPRGIEDIQTARILKKTRETIMPATENSKIVQIEDNNAYLDSTATTKIQKAIPTPTTREPEYFNDRCRFHQFNRMMENRWWCNGGNISVLDHIPNSAERIDIIDSNIPAIPASAFVRFSNLTKLLFYNTNIHEVDPLAFVTLDKLEWLVFFNNSMPTIKSSWFHGLVNITLLGLVRNSITKIESDVFEYIPNLERLFVQENNLRCIYTKSLSSLKYLQRVAIQRNPWKWRCQEELVQFFQARDISYVKSEA